MLTAARPWPFVELSLVDLPYAARAIEEGERHRPTNRQQFGRPDDRHADASAGRAVVTRPAAAEARGGEAAIGPALEVDQPPRAAAARAVYVQLKAVNGYVADRLEWKLAEHARDLECGCCQIIFLHLRQMVRHHIAAVHAR